LVVTSNKLFKENLKYFSLVYVLRLKKNLLLFLCSHTHSLHCSACGSHNSFSGCFSLSLLLQLFIGCTIFQRLLHICYPLYKELCRRSQTFISNRSCFLIRCGLDLFGAVHPKKKGPLSSSVPTIISLICGPPSRAVNEEIFGEMLTCDNSGLKQRKLITIE
jgi:hypothetical protein